MKSIKFFIPLTIIMLWTLNSVRANFIHPGMRNTLEELEFIRANKDKEPWNIDFIKAQNHSWGNLNYTPHPHTTMNNNSKTDFRNDGCAAYTHALLWFMFSLDNPLKAEQHAQKSVQIMDAWSGTVTGTGSDTQIELRAGIYGGTWCNAAEIILHTYANENGKSWDNAQRFKNMVSNHFWHLVTRRRPTCHNQPGCGYPGKCNDTEPRASNWETSWCETMIAIAVLTDDTSRFHEGITFWRWLADGKNIISDKGENNETCRDCNHPQGGLGHLVKAAEIAYHQGVDLYSEFVVTACVPTKPPVCTGFRLANAAEFTGAILDGITLPTPVSAISCYSGRCSSANCGSTNVIKGMFELVYNHYNNRLGIELPYTWKMVKKYRDSASETWNSLDHIPWVTLTHAQLPISTGNETYQIKNIDTEGYILYQNYPNPFNPDTEIHYNVAQASHISIQIFDMLGKRIKTLANKNQSAGLYSVHWYGNNDFHQPVASGVYLCKMRIKDRSGNITLLMDKLLLIK